ncbi:MAG: hypothetical protein GF401_19225 [Chitinivibrionales bacterium]|nr:hypothetical protein [Chitinivibrionales bacterium]
MYPGINTISKSYIFRLFGTRGTALLLKSSIFSINHYYLMKGNLKFIPYLKIQNRLKGNFRKVTKEDIFSLKNRLETLSFYDKRELLSRILFYNSGFTNCYGFFADNKIAYIQWLIYPSENYIIEKDYATKFYPLSPKQVMIENAFTFPEYRGYGLYRTLTHKLCKQVYKEGYTTGLCYTRKDKTTPLNEFYLLGFKIDKLLTEYKFLFRTWRNLD